MVEINPRVFVLHGDIEFEHGGPMRLDRSFARRVRDIVTAPWILSIRAKIFFGCISLTFVTILVGVLSQSAQGQLSYTALGIFDNAFIPMSYLRSAQSIILGISRDLAVGEKNNAQFVDQLQSVLDALDVARERALSPGGEEIAKKLQTAVTDLQERFKTTAEGPSRRQFTAIEQRFDMAVGIYAADGFRLRGSVEALVRRTRMQTYLAIIGSIVTAIIITLLLSRAIVPSIRHAVRIATAIASGQLDNKIDRSQPSETGVLLNALATMQDSIAEKISCIETLMARQASSHAAETALQHARFEAALDNMTLGLRMFDAGNALLVQNKRFTEMSLPDTMDANVTLATSAVDDVPPTMASRSFKCLLDDGRIISVSEEDMAGGGRVVTYEDITERQRADARLSHMARHDALTGLPNRVLFREQLEVGMTKTRHGGRLSVLCLDLDRFKTVNDTLGHPIGDALLKETAARLLEVTGESDTVVRLGGDEFAVIRHAARPSEEPEALAARLIAVVARPFEIEGHHITIGVSIGIAETDDGLVSPDDLLKNADLALYNAKADGRGIYRLFESEMDAFVQKKRGLELDLRHAIADEQFELYYQPLLNARTGAVVAFEALLRWRHSIRGMIPPTDFIPLLEETGLIPRLGLWVLNQACRDALDWPDDVKVAINLSPLQFRSGTLVDVVAEALEASTLPATRLELEITESLMLQDTEMTLTTLHDLRMLGVCISMDDFGTGYSSLGYLLRFPFDKMKIDRSFISGMTDTDGLAIVRAVIALGQSLRINVVAEGVETKEQMDLLCLAGCQELQGYLFSRPQPKAALKEIIERYAIKGCAA